VSPSTGYQGTGNDNVPHYQYDPYAQASPHYQMSPTDTQSYMYSQPNSASYHPPQVDSSGQWTHYQQDYMQPHMEPASALMALSGSEANPQHSPQAQQGQQMPMPYDMPNLMPAAAGPMRHPEEDWPHHTWGNHDAGGE